MLSTVKYITPNINNQPWNIGNDIGHNFEDHIYKSIVKKYICAIIKIQVKLIDYLQDLK